MQQQNSWQRLAVNASQRHRQLPSRRFPLLLSYKYLLLALFCRDDGHAQKIGSSCCDLRMGL